METAGAPFSRSTGEVILDYGNVSILVPQGHMLPVHLQSHPFYDRFLPVLVHVLGDEGTVVDVGANIGDTVAGMVSANPALHYVCVEADPEFFELLERNAQRIESQVPGIGLSLVQSLAGKNVRAGTLEGKGGTKHAVPSLTDAATPSVPLDDILQELSCSDVRLLKTDVDGFDYDVLDSSWETIRSSRPLLFFECFYENQSQRDGYGEIIGRLAERGDYGDWTVFDNYGQVLVRTPDARTVIQLLDYVWRQKSGPSSRTIPYFDILAAPATRGSTVDDALNLYLNTDSHSLRL